MIAVRSLALLVARLVLGFVFIMHGWQKLHTYGISNVEKSFDAMGVPAPALSAQYATWVELIGGVALIVGVLLPLVGVLLAADMLGAMTFAHWDAGFWNADQGYELVLGLLAAALAVGFAKPGIAALDHYLFRWQRED